MKTETEKIETGPIELTDTAAVAPRLEPAEPFALWAESLGQVLGKHSGASLPWTMQGVSPETSAVALPAPSAGDLWIGCASAGALRGEMSLRIPEPSLIPLGRLFRSESQLPDSEISSQTTPQGRDTVLELFRQVAATVAAGFSDPGEVQLSIEIAAGPPSWGAATTAYLTCQPDPSATLLIEIQLSPAFVASLRERQNAPSASATAARERSDEKSSEQKKVQFDLLMDVELEVTLLFGRRRLLLREILELNPGSVVELDRLIQEPVDVLLDGRSVARGEVVVIDGNYGLRVTQVGPADMTS